MRDNVCVVIIGDVGTGKTSLLTTYMSQHFEENVPRLMSDCIVPSSYTDGSVTLLDSSAHEDDRETLFRKIRSADTIILCHDSTDISTLHNVHKKWLPLVCDTIGDDKEKYVVVASTKCDIIGDNYYELLEQSRTLWKEILEDYPIVCCCNETSSKNVDVDGVFRMAESVVLFPYRNIHDREEDWFTDACLRAFKRIFRICDVDGDGLWSNMELKAFQQSCFGISMSETEVNAIKKQITKQPLGRQEHVRVVHNNMITFDGFLHMMKILLNRIELQPHWTILRHFGYDDDLELEIPEFLTLDESSFYALEDGALRFLSNLLLLQLSNDGEAAINTKFSRQHINEVFSVISDPSSLPWNMPYYEDGEDIFVLHGLSLLDSEEGMPMVYWLNHWHMLVTHRPYYVQELLYRLGYLSSTSGVLVYDNHISDGSRYSAKIEIVGDSGVGKLSLLYSLSQISADTAQLLSTNLEHKKSNSPSAGDQNSIMLITGNYSEFRGRMTHLVYSSVLQTKYVVEMDPIANENYRRSVLNYYNSMALQKHQYKRLQYMYNYDLVVLLFHYYRPESFYFVRQLEEAVKPHQPRLYVASRIYRDHLHTPNVDIRSSSPEIEDDDSTYDEAVEHVRQERIHPVEVLSSFSKSSVGNFVHTVQTCLRNPIRAIPAGVEQVSYLRYIYLQATSVCQDYLSFLFHPSSFTSVYMAYMPRVVAGIIGMSLAWSYFRSSSVVKYLLG